MQISDRQGVQYTKVHVVEHGASSLSCIIEMGVKLLTGAAETNG